MWRYEFSLFKLELPVYIANYLEDNFLENVDAS